MRYTLLPWAIALTAVVLALVRMKPEQIDKLDATVASCSFALLLIGGVAWLLTYLWLKVFGVL